MTALARVLLLLWLLAVAAATAAGEPAVAVVDGQEISLEDLGPALDAGVRSAELARLVRKHLFRAYVRANGLEAAPHEVEALRAYDAEFARKDRAQRRRKLEELESRLAAASLTDMERARLVEFHDILKRMADADSARDREPPEATRDPDTRAPWIELWKMHRSLYEEYGGEVLLVEYGPYPKDAWLRLLTDRERAGDLRFGDSTWRDRVFAQFAGVPGVPLPPEKVDFTPYWQRPIPPSYFPDHGPEETSVGPAATAR